MYSHSKRAPSEKPSTTGSLQPSRSYLTLADLDRDDDVGNDVQGAADMQSNGQQVTLVQGDIVSIPHPVSREDLKPNPFVDVLPSNVRTKVVSLTSPRSGGAVYNNSSTNSISRSASLNGRQTVKERSSSLAKERKGWKSHKVALLSLVILLIAVFFKQDLNLRSNESLGVTEFLRKYQPHLQWSYTSIVQDVGEKFSLLFSDGSGEAILLREENHDDSQHWDVHGGAWSLTRDNAPLLTEWGERMEPKDVVSHERHPRPQLERPGKWMNLNGFWDFKVENVTTNTNDKNNFSFGKDCEGKILVPFAIESALSGVAKGVSSNKQLVYRRYVNLGPPTSSNGGERYIIHFGAVDWETRVYLNGDLVGSHKGGFDAFHFDVTDHVRRRAAQKTKANQKSSHLHELTVVVVDPTEDGHQPHGKQWQDKQSDRIIAPAGMWYTSVTGIWQTVWLETVPETFHIESMKLVPDIKGRSVSARIETKSHSGLMPYVKLTAYDEHGIVGFGSGWSGGELKLHFNENHIPKLWSPDSPFLYDLVVSLHLSGEGEVVDEVKSYFAMREITLGRSGDAVQFFLNGKPEFQYGVLDQGWWPDGLYTPPSEDAMEFDILKAKELGFNLIRKHAKVEPDRFYHLCDKLGMLVWQDMPSASGVYMWSPDGAHDYKEGEKSPESASSFMSELSGVMESLYNHPSIVAWIPFNEGWGQFNTKDIFSWMESFDPQRLVWVSGGNDFGIGSAFDRHVYPGPSFVRLEHCRASVLGEFGGNGFAIEGHTWDSDADGAYDTFLNWGYAGVKSLAELQAFYLGQMRELDALVKRGLGAAIFTQLSDVESEFNGLMTYDRKVLKLNPEDVRPLHQALYDSGSMPKFQLHDANSTTTIHKTKCLWE